MSSTVIRQSLVPMLIFYIVIMTVAAVGLRMSRRQADGAPPAAGKPSGPATRATSAALWPPALRPLAARGPGWVRVVTQYLYTALGGYLLLMVVVISYYYGIAKAGDLIVSAFTGCALLLGLSAPVFLAVSWLVKRRS